MNARVHTLFLWTPSNNRVGPANIEINEITISISLTTDTSFTTKSIASLNLKINLEKYESFSCQVRDLNLSKQVPPQSSWSMIPGRGITMGVIGCPDGGILMPIRYDSVHLVRVWFLNLYCFGVSSHSLFPSVPAEAVFSRRASLAISDGALLGGKGRHKRGRLERPSARGGGR